MNIGAGILFLVQYRASILLLSLVLAAAYVIVGSFRAATAFAERAAHWRVIFALGCLYVVLGGLIGARWQESDINMIGRFVGINLIVEGFTWLMIVWHAWRRDSEDAQKGPVPK